MKLKKCTICGTEFMSSYGREVCGDNCFAERQKQYYTDTALRRKNGIAGKPRILKCLYCEKNFEGLGRKYCTDECSNTARQIQRNKIAKEYYDDSEWRLRHIANVKNRNKK